MTCRLRPHLRLGATALAAASLGLLSSPGRAQSTVSISGTVDIGVYRAYDKTKQVGPISRSYLTFSGSEDLGGGLSAFFTLTHRFDPDTGTVEASGKPFWHGESTVGLKGGFGTLRLGRALDVINANDWAFDPWDNFDRLASPAWQYWHYNYATDRTSNSGGAEYGRVSNGIFYDSPKVAGFSLALSGSPEKSSAPGGATQGSHQAALKYGAGPAAAIVAYGRNGNGDTDTFVAGKVVFGDLAVMGGWDRSVFQGAAADSTATAVTLGATYQLGATLLQAGIGRQKLDGATNKFAAVGARYSLSKRTYVYADLGHSRPDDAASATAFGVGINHSF